MTMTPFLVLFFLTLLCEATAFPPELDGLLPQNIVCYTSLELSSIAMGDS